MKPYLLYANYIFLIHTEGFPGGSISACSTGNMRDVGLIPGLGRSPGEGNGNPTLVFLPGEFNGQRSLAGFSPWGCRVRQDSATNAFTFTQSYGL